MTSLLAIAIGLLIAGAIICARIIKRKNLELAELREMTICYGCTEFDDHSDHVAEGCIRYVEFSCMCKIDRPSDLPPE